MERLRVEAVAVAAGDRGHAWAEAADDDRRRRIGPKKSGLAAPELPHERDSVDHALRAHGVGVDGLANRRLLRRVRRAATAAGAEPRSNRPPEMPCSVAAMFARTPGARLATLSTRGPSMTRFVTSASAVSTVHASGTPGPPSSPSGSRR